MKVKRVDLQNKGASTIQFDVPVKISAFEKLAQYMY